MFAVSIHYNKIEFIDNLILIFDVIFKKYLCI